MCVLVACILINKLNVAYLIQTSINIRIITSVVPPSASVRIQAVTSFHLKHKGNTNPVDIEDKNKGSQNSLTNKTNNK